jgi:hypothetical protein
LVRTSGLAARLRSKPGVEEISEGPRRHGAQTKQVSHFAVH